MDTFQQKYFTFQPEDRVFNDIQKAQLYAARSAKKSFKQKKLKIFAEDTPRGTYP